MSKVVFDISMSLDGFMTAANRRPEEPMGDGGQRLHEWAITHEAPTDSPEGGVYTFVTDGIERALEQARAAAGDRNVGVMGGASIGQQFIAAGLVDEVQVHLVPVLFGSGMRMFEQPGDEHIQLQPVEVIETPAAIHLRFRIVK